jgi:hypothetical protein
MAGKASKKRQTRAPRTKRQADTEPQTLDLTRRERPTVRLDCGEFKMRRPEEFYFRDFAGIVTIGERITELTDGGVVEHADELDKLIGESVNAILVDATEEALQITPSLFGELFDFFNGLVSKKGKGASGSASSSSPGASDSTEASEAA